MQKVLTTFKQCIENAYFKKKNIIKALILKCDLIPTAFLTTSDNLISQ